jgi:hypothetical protein
MTALKILSWFLGILLSVSLLVIAFEFFGSDQFRPTAVFGLRSDQRLSQIQDEQKKQSQKLDELTNKINELKDKSSTSSSVADMPVVQRPTTPTLSFNQCVAQGGLDEKAKVATTASNKCQINGQVSRPAVFNLTDENLTYVAPYGSGGAQVKNVADENFYFRGGSSDFGTEPKIGDKFMVTARVANDAGVYYFDSLTKVQKMS